MIILLSVFEVAKIPAVKLVTLLITAWCVMVSTHELGHILCGYMGGAVLQQADLVPWHLPYSIFAPDPYPLFTMWGGPLLGVAVPMLVAFVVRRNWMWFIGYFCCIANGTYIATAWLSGDSYLDTTKLLELGSPPIIIALYCAMTITVGYVGFRTQCIHLLRTERIDESIHVTDNDV